MAQISTKWRRVNDNTTRKESQSDCNPSPGELCAVGIVGGGEPPLVCGRGRMAWLLLGHSTRMLERAWAMSYQQDLNDPVFYDDAIWTQCNTCDEYFDQSKYNSRTCMVCENNEREGKGK